MMDGDRDQNEGSGPSATSDDVSIPSTNSTASLNEQMYVLGRPDHADKNSIDATKVSNDEMDRLFDRRMARKGKLRNESWASFRHILTMIWFVSGSLLIFVALAFSIIVMVTESHSRLELAHRLLETLLGGLGAGLIGLFAVKSFEK